MHANQKDQHNEIKYLNAGDSCILILLGNEISIEMHKRIKNYYHYINNQKFTGILEVVPAYRSISVYYDPLVVLPTQVLAWLQGMDSMVLTDARNDSTRRLHIPVCFDGDYGFDLHRVAKFHNLSKQEVVNIFCAQDYLNYFIGFMPGKPYLGGLPEILETPRLDVPRIKLPSGTVVIYGKQAAIFGIEQPSGANCIGRSPIRIYDTRKEDPTLLQMGDLLRFFPISLEEFSEIAERAEAMEYQVQTEYV